MIIYLIMIQTSNTNVLRIVINVDFAFELIDDFSA